ncbi:hypothetical protein [Haloplasma contractile]|uniref:Uncharacterized protein n=1 Tax=Haloplasma contractile SSD-17B TaxID=1033810 RepID=F7Q156_9MOLU|nr:hypothetical protein [Haloplasma contractile]ERJ11302.1 hypothetical protein HLPCO_002604 [Haloplasma contractile SSD-17B]
MSDKTVDNIYFLTMGSTEEGNFYEGTPILENKFFTSKKDALKFAEDYLYESLDLEHNRDLLRELDVNISRGSVQLYCDFFTFDIQVHAVKESSLNKVLTNLEKGSDLYYIDYFTSLYYLDGDEVVEQDEMKNYHVLGDQLFNNRDEAIQYVIHSLNNHIPEANRIHIMQDDDAYSMYGLYNPECGFEQHYTIKRISKSHLIDLLGTTHFDYLEITKEPYLNENVDAINRLTCDYTNEEIYELLSNGVEEYDPW